MAAMVEAMTHPIPNRMRRAVAIRPVAPRGAPALLTIGA